MRLEDPIAFDAARLDAPIGQDHAEKEESSRGNATVALFLASDDSSFVKWGGVVGRRLHVGHLKSAPQLSFKYGRPLIMRAMAEITGQEF